MIMKNFIILFVLCMTTFAVTANATTTNNDDPTPIIKATFDGGQIAYQNYIQKNLQYPNCARENGVEGLVTISFFVLADGTIHGAKVVEGMNDKCDQVALEVISNMPKWVPAQKAEKPTATKNYISLNFFLEG